jgi:PAS domain S-box-containing protein
VRANLPRSTGAAGGQRPPVAPWPPAEDASLFRLLVDSVVDDAMVLLTPEGHIASWNPGAERLAGYTADEIVGQPFDHFYTEEDRAAGKPGKLLVIARLEGRVEDDGWRVRKDGSRFRANMVITALHDQTHTLRGFAAVTRNLPPRGVREHGLLQCDNRFGTLVDSIKDYAIFMLSPEGRVLTWNQGAERLKGYAPNEIVGQGFERFYTDEARRAGLPHRLLAAARAEGRVEDEGWRVRKDGSLFWADVVITALTDADNRLIGYAKVTRDLSERRRAEQDRAARLAAERTAERIERLQVATAALAAASRPEHAAEVLIDVAIRAFEAAAGAMAVPTADGSALEVVDARGYLPGIVQSDRHVGADESILLSYTWRTNQALFLGSRAQVQTEHPELMATLAASRFEAWVATPLVIDRRILGVLGLSFDQQRVLNPDERGFLLTLAEVGAQAIDRARLFESEQLARTDAEAAVRAQDEFLSLAAHELRTPVAAVKATAQLAERTIARGGIDPDRLARHLQSIARVSDRLGALIDDLLDVSRLRTGRLRLRRKQVELVSIVHEVMSRYRATEHRHQFVLTASERGARVDADPLRLEQVLDNLLSNAVKYSPNGGPIEVQVSHESDGVTLTVADRGIGLPAGEELRIFEAFGRGSNATTRQIQGLGLGLSICRQLVEVHGGRIWATSPGEGHGTSFSIWLPAMDVAEQDGRHHG